jgi:hypothetical protein
MGSDSLWLADAGQQSDSLKCTDSINSEEAENVLDGVSSLDMPRVADPSNISDPPWTCDAMTRVSFNSLEGGLKLPDGRKCSVTGSQPVPLHKADSLRPDDAQMGSDRPVKSLAGSFAESTSDDRSR